MVVAKTNWPKHRRELEKDTDQLRKLLARMANTQRTDDLRRYEYLAFEVCREMILKGGDPASVKNPYEVSNDG